MKWNRKRVVERLIQLKKELNRKPVKRDDSQLYNYSRKYFGSWNKMMNFAGYPCGINQVPVIPKKLTNNLFHFLGLLSTDGHIQFREVEKKYKVNLYTSEKEEVKLILKLIFFLFGYKAKVRKRKTGFSERYNFEVYITSKKVVKFLINLGIPFGSKSFTMKVPMLIIQNKNNIFWHYLRGVFDGDGSIIFSKSNKVFKITSGSKEFLNGLQRILFLYEFYKLKISKQKGNVWELRICNISDIRKLFYFIYKDASFYYPRKKSKWENQHI